jgi:hypothetical protein
MLVRTASSSSVSPSRRRCRRIRTPIGSFADAAAVAGVGMIVGSMASYLGSQGYPKAQRHAR